MVSGKTPIQRREARRNRRGDKIVKSENRFQSRRPETISSIIWKMSFLSSSNDSISSKLSEKMRKKNEGVFIAQRIYHSEHPGLVIEKPESLCP